MKLRYAMVLGSLVGAMFLGIAQAAEPAAGGPDTVVRRENATVERRVAELEAQLERLQRELKELRAAKEATPAKSDAREMRVFALRYVSADAMVDSLKPLITGESAKEIRIVADTRTNRVIVQATTKRMEAFSKLILLIDSVVGDDQGTGAPK